MKRIIKIIIILITVCFNTYGQFSCLTSQHLKKIYDSPLSEISILLQGEGWNFNGMTLVSTKDIFGVDLKYDKIIFVGNNDSLLILQKNDIRKSVIYKSEKLCYGSILKEIQTINPKSVISSLSNNLLTHSYSFSKNLDVIEFREYVNKYGVFSNDIRSNNYIILYNKKVIENESANQKNLEDKILRERNLITSSIEFLRNLADNSIAQTPSKFVKIGSELKKNVKEIEVLSIEEKVKLDEELNDFLFKGYVFKLDSISTGNSNISEEGSNLLEDFKKLSPKEEQINSLEEKLNKFIILYKENDLATQIDNIKSSIEKKHFKEVLFEIENFKKLNLVFTIENSNKLLKEINTKYSIKLTEYLFFVRNSLIDLEDYKEALSAQNMLLSMPNISWEREIRVLNEIKSELKLRVDRRTIIFDYNKLNGDNVKRLDNQLQHLLYNKYIETNKSGIFNFIYQIKFDTNGTNFSNIKLGNFSTNGKSLNNPIQNSLFNDLLPSKVKSLFLASEFEKSNSLIWESKNLEVINYKKFKSNSQAALIPEIRNYIENSTINGAYTFQIKDVQYNNLSDQSVQLTGLSKTRGPMNAFLSLIVPGWGTYRTSYGAKGWSRLSWILLSVACATYTGSLSDDYYKKYMSATTQIEMNKNYNQANLYNKVSNGFVNISATIYFGEFLSSFVNGVKNSINSQKLKNQIQSEKIVIKKFKY